MAKCVKEGREWIDKLDVICDVSVVGLEPVRVQETITYKRHVKTYDLGGKELGEPRPVVTFSTDKAPGFSVTLDISQLEEVLGWLKRWNWREGE